MKTYKTLINRTLDLSGLSEAQREVLDKLLKLYRDGISWKDFSNTRQGEVKRALPDLSTSDRQKHPIYLVAEDLEFRLGISQGIMAPPDYRDYLVEAIIDKYGTRYRFCKETGISSSLLSQVLSGKKDFSISKLKKVSKALGLSLVFVPSEELRELHTANS